MQFFRIIIWVQGIYTLLTAIWPIVDIDSFMAVTGYKTDIWLVRTVGALLIPVAICLISFLFTQTDRRPAFILGSFTSVAFICIDFYYALTDVIPDIYMVDGFVQIVLLFSWIYIGIKRYDVLIHS